ncbi:MAG TPA: hypothetical protein VE442_21420, partial [Jatrophihabitans sp.]|nr:hypothetical protein [Jatrophihabitans sp.]
TAQHMPEPAATEDTVQQVPEPAATEDTVQHVPEPAATEETSPALFEADELQTVINRWREIRAGFVDQPKRAMQDADALVTELMERLTRRFAEEHERLEARWSEQETISTEDLRQGLQRYRSFFERLLAA